MRIFSIIRRWFGTRPPRSDFRGVTYVPYDIER